MAVGHVRKLGVAEEVMLLRQEFKPGTMFKCENSGEPCRKGKEKSCQRVKKQAGKEGEVINQPCGRTEISIIWIIEL